MLLLFRLGGCHVSRLRVEVVNMTRHIFGLFIIGMAAYALTQGQLVLGIIGALAGLAIVSPRPGEWGQ